MAADSVTVSPTFNGDSVSLTSGMIVRLKPGANNNVVRAQADSAPHVQGVNGVVVSGASAPTGVVTVVSVGRQTVQMESALTPAVGDTVYVSAAVAGKGTNVIPGIVLPIGSIADISGYASGKTVEVDVVAASSESGAGGTFPGFGGAPPAVAAASDGGAAGTASRSDHTHAGVTSLNGEQGAVTAQSTGGTVLITEPAPGQVNFEVTNPVPAFATPVDLGPNEGVSGIASTIIRSDAIPGQKIEAQWPIANPRYYAVDGQAGNDANAGFSDVSMAAAGAVALKTIGQLNKIFPRVGAGRIVIVAIRANAANAAYTDAPTFMITDGGYNQFVIYGTDTNATAGAVAFAGGQADYTFCGAMAVPGTNVSGYNPTGTPTTSSVQCLKVGGGAPGFAAEPAAPLMFRMRFDSATTTVALRNLVRTVRMVSGGDTLSPDALWPAVPVASDVFYLEKPGVLMPFPSGGAAFSAYNSGSSASATLAGIDFTSSANFVNSRANLAFLHSTGSLNQIGGVIFWNNQINPPGFNAVVGGCCAETTVSMTSPVSTTCDGMGARGGLWSVRNPLAFDWQAGCVAAAGIVFDGLNNGCDKTGIPVGMIGARSGNGRACRILAPGTPSGGIAAGLNIWGGSGTLGDIQITGMGAHPAIAIAGAALLSLAGNPTTGEGVAGSTGNTDVGVDFSTSISATIFIGTGNTVTGTAGDIRLSDGSIVSWATAGAGVIDTNGDRLFAAGNAPDHPIPVATGAGVLTVTNAPAGATAYARYFKIPDGAGGFLTIGSLT